MMNLLLVAGVQAVNVVNNPALHVKVVNTPLPITVTKSLPVRVANFPGPDLIAWVTMWVAIATLLGVGFQILLARRQITLAEQELQAVRTDLQNNTEQFKEFLRRPNLSLAIRQYGMEQVYHGETSWNLFVQLDVFNNGNRGVRDFMVEFLVPTDALFNLDEVRRAGPLYRTIEQKSYAIWSSRNKDHVLFPAPVPLTFKHNFKIKADGGPWTALYKIYDDFATYPDEGYSEAELESRRAPVKRVDNPRE